MTKAEQNKFAKHIMRLLKVEEVIFPICRTNKGNFGLRYGVNTEDYEMYLDAVPLPTKDFLNDDNNIELKKMLEKYLFDEKEVFKGFDTLPSPAHIRNEVGQVSFSEKPKRGRPKGSKNKNADSKAKKGSA